MSVEALFTFNGKRGDLSQVEPYYEEFLRVFEEVQRRPGFAYNDDFKGRIPAIANTKHRGPSLGTHEDTAIYMLQILKRQREQDARVAVLLAEGWEHVETIEDKERFAAVVLYSPDLANFQGEWMRFEGARLVIGDESRAPCYVLPKGKRTYGHLISGRRVLVLR